MTTAGKNSGVIATDRGSGTITVSGGTMVAMGVDSPAIYSPGNIAVSDTNLTASGAEAVVIEAGNTITLKNVDLSSTLASKRDVMIYQSMSGDAEGTRGTFSMTGGSLSYTWATSPLFYATTRPASSRCGVSRSRRPLACWSTPAPTAAGARAAPAVAR